MIEALFDIKTRIEEFFMNYPLTLEQCRYADLRIGASDTRWAFSEDGKSKAAGRDETASFGIRVIGGEIQAPGYYGATFSLQDLSKVEDLIKEGLLHAYRRAISNSKKKKEFMEKYDQYGKSLWNMNLSPSEVNRDSVPAHYSIDPLRVDEMEILRISLDASKYIKDMAGIRFNDVSIYTQLLGEVFVSTEGASIEQYFAYTQGSVYVVASGKEGQQELYEYIGDQRGFEVIVEGANVHNMDIYAFSRRVASDAIALSDAKPMKPSEKEVVVVTDPYFNSLLVHEIIGHPMEADRVLKYETAYAGRSWFFKGFNENFIGKQVASPLITAFSDPSLPGYGHYVYDHEGVRGKKVIHIEKGILKGFMNSRQTASLLGVEPNGSYTATDPSLVPLIRMSTTVFAGGNTPPEKIIEEVSDGYYLWGMHIPSISESRENFTISAIKTYRIQRGELKELYRGGGITSDSMSFLMSIDAVGNDFKIYPVANCGKGQPMQTKRLGNGGPTLRGRARVTGTGR